MNRLLPLVLFALLTHTTYSQSKDDTFIKALSAKHWDTLLLYSHSSDHAEININGKTVVIFGTTHGAGDPRDSMFANMKKSVLNLNPSIILTEQYGSIAATEEETIKKYGDMGITKFLAIKNNIEIRSWDDNWNNIYNELVKVVPSNDIYVAMTSMASFWYHPDPGTSFYDFLSAAYSGLEQIGFPFTAEQINNANYAQFFGNCFGRPFEFPTTEAYLDFLSKSTRLKDINSSLQVVRELHFAHVIKETLKKHDRVFIQAGFSHVPSMKKIVELILENKVLAEFPATKKNTVSPDLLKDFRNSNRAVQNNSIKKFKTGNTQALLYHGPAKSTDFNDAQQHYDEIEKELQIFKPSLVLTDGFSTMYQTKDEIMRYCNDAELCRNIGILSGFTVNSWAPSWNDIYYELNKKHNAQDLFFVGMSLCILEGKRKYSTYLWMLDYGNGIYDEMSRRGFPFQLNQLNYFSYQNICQIHIGDYFNLTSDQMFFDAIEKALQKNHLAKIVTDIKNIKVKALMQFIQKECKPGARLFVQVPADLVASEILFPNGLE